MVITDEDAAMQAPQGDSPQWRTVQELQRYGWQYSGRDASGRRIAMRRGNARCRVDEDGSARR